MDELKEMGSKAIAIHADVRNEEDVNNLISRTVDEYGRLDIISTMQKLHIKKGWKKSL